MSMRFLFILIGILAVRFDHSSAFVSPPISGASSTPLATATIRPDIIRCNNDATAPTKPPTAATIGGGGDNKNIFNSFLSSIFNNRENGGQKSLAARSLLLSLINDERCFSTVDGAKKFAMSCAVDVVYEDCYASSQPIVGRSAVEEHLTSRALSRVGGGTDEPGFRIDRISDGSIACGFAWTWTSPSSSTEGLRGTTFVELDPTTNEIRYVREIPEPLYKPGNLILDLLKAATANAVPKPPPQFVRRSPTAANEVAKYLFNDLQGSDSSEAMRFFDEGIVYRDFNFEEVLRGKVEVKKFIDDFSFPGITFATQRFDDGVKSTCFTWEVVLDGAPEGSTTKGISFYEVDPVTGLITYVRDVPESGIKPPPLGRLARLIRPALGVFQPVAIGSRASGL